MAQQIAPAQQYVNQLNTPSLAAVKSTALNKEKTTAASVVAAPLKTAELQAKVTASAKPGVKNASEFMVSRLGKESLAKMQLYKPSGFVGMAPERATGSFAPPQASYARRMSMMPSLSDIADNGINPLRAAKSQNAFKAGESGGCKTCQERVYQDGSDDAGVSFQTPTGIPSSTAGIAVASHEGEHVTRETEKARQEGRVVTNKKVTFQYACCPECHKMYVAGGTTSISTVDAGSASEVNSALELMGAAGDDMDEDA